VSQLRCNNFKALEAEFAPLLISCLKACQKGRSGLFGQNVGEEAERYLKWPEADRLKLMAHQVRSPRSEFGAPNTLVESFLGYCSLRGANVKSEPKIAKAFLEAIRGGQFGDELVRQLR
jgi:hypothetical protein